MKMTTPGSIGGMKVAIACPNRWLSGSRFRNLNGKKGVPHFRYFRISRSTGTMLASTLPWVISTPLGSAVAPDVKMISATSLRAMSTVGGAASCQSMSGSFHTVASVGTAIGGTSWPIRMSLAETIRLTRARKSGDAR